MPSYITTFLFSPNETSTISFDSYDLPLQLNFRINVEDKYLFIMNTYENHIITNTSTSFPNKRNIFIITKEHPFKPLVSSSYISTPNTSFSTTSSSFTSPNIKESSQTPNLLFKQLNQKRFNHLRNSINIELYREANMNTSDPSNENGNTFIINKTIKTGKVNQKKKKKKRKFKPDDIRKKIKARFHKTLKTILNKYLLCAGSQMVFNFLPQCFLVNITKKINHFVLNLTLRELIEFDFCKELNERGVREKNVDMKKYLHNKMVLNYLDHNNEISEKSGFTVFSKKTYRELLKEFFASEEFLASLKRLKMEGETDEYIFEYKKKALGYVSFFVNANEEWKPKE